MFSNPLNYIGSFTSLPVPSLSSVGDLCVVNGTMYAFTGTEWDRLEGGVYNMSSCYDNESVPYIKDGILIFDNYPKF